MRVLVCGGRYFSDQAHLFKVLDQLHNDGTRITHIIEGEAKGADQLSALWASRRQVALLPYPADWQRFGQYDAGPIRNKQMLVEGKPDLVVAFKGGTGTADMIEQARKAGVKVLEAY